MQIRPEEFITAALLHDIGHLLPGPEHVGLGRIAHQNVGADYLKQLKLSPTVVELIRSHVDAKRYLVSKEPDYYEFLSDASKETLKLQGGPMTPDECSRFENDPLFELKILLRQCDELAKRTTCVYVPTNIIDLMAKPCDEDNEVLPDLDSYKEIIQSCIMDSEI